MRCLKVFLTVLLTCAMAETAHAAIAFGSSTATEIKAASITVNRPASTASGDLLLAQITYDKGSSMVLTPPTGWTLVVRTDLTNTLGQAIYYKVATGSEPANYTWTTPGSTRMTAAILRYTGVDASNPIVASSGNSGTTNPMRGLSVASVTNSMLVGLWVLEKKDATLSTPTGMTQVYQQPDPLTDQPIMAAQQLDPPNPTGNKDSTASATGNWLAHLVTLRPAVPTTPGSFNAFETSTAANAITGQVYTKPAGVNFAVDVVAILAGAQMSTFTNAVQVDLVTGASGGANCPGTPVSVSSAQSVNLTSGRGTSGAFNIANAYPDVRVRIRFPVAAPTVTSCSTDNFAIRPSSITVSSTNATNNGTGAGATTKTGANFNLTAATGLTGYNGTPTIDNTLGMVIGSPNAGTIGGSFSAAVSGTATGNSFFYSEAGNFGLSANAVRDTTFTAVDQPNDCTADFSNSLVGGKYGCYFGNSLIAMTPGTSGFGRFIPDNFNVTYNAPIFTTACGTGGSSFTYVGQSLPYQTAPVMTITARSGTANGLTNSTTLNYSGAYMKLANSGTSLNQAPYDSQAGRYARFDALGGGSTPALDTSVLPATTGAGADPTISTFTNGVGTLTFAPGLAFTRSTTTPSAPFNADIELALNIVDSDGVAFASNPARFGQASAGNGIAFTQGKSQRYGRTRVSSAVGSEKLNLSLQLSAEYWSGSAFFPNTLDNCTSVTAKNIQLFNHQGGITPGNMVSPTAGSNGNVSTTGTFTNGVASVTLLRPTGSPATGGSVDICVDLDVTAPGVDATCQAAIPGDRTWLRTSRTIPPSAYNQDPVGRAWFGLYGGQPSSFIYLRENY